MKLRLTTVLFAAASATLQAAVSYNGGTYSQNFDSLSGVSTWANDTTLTGWFARTDATASITAIGSNTGSTTTAGLYSYGVNATNPLAERSIGFATSNAFTGASGTGRNYLGVNFTNSSGSAYSSFTIGYDGEQWRRENSTATHTMTVEYSFDATSLTTGTWTSAGAGLNFASPQTGSTGLALDGNAAANRATGLTGTVSSISWSNGGSLWIRFVDLNDSGNDHHLTVDNFSLVAVPEPAAALLGGLGFLALLRRRR
jgi:hypothetical protein